MLLILLGKLNDFYLRYVSLESAVGIGAVGDGLDAAVGEVDGVLSEDGALVVLGLCRLVVGAGVLVGHAVLELVGLGHVLWLLVGGLGRGVGLGRVLHRRRGRGRDSVGVGAVRHGEGGGEADDGQKQQALNRGMRNVIKELLGGEFEIYFPTFMVVCYWGNLLDPFDLGKSFD